MELKGSIKQNAENYSTERLSGFMCYNAYLEATEEMTDSEFREYVLAIRDYVTLGRETEFKTTLPRVAFRAIKGSIDSSIKRYMEKKYGL